MNLYFLLFFTIFNILSSLKNQEYILKIVILTNKNSKKNTIFFNPTEDTLNSYHKKHIITMKNNILQLETEIKKIIETLNTIKLLNTIINTSHKNLIF